MKLKYYLRGLGAGIIFTSVILMIIYAYRTTDTRIKERAKELGMVETSDKDSEKDSDKDDTKEQTTKEPENEEETTAPPDAGGESEPPDTEDKEITITITDGMYSEAICRSLYDAGLIDNVAAFNRFLADNGYAEKIKAGTYQMRAGMTYEDMANIITK